MSDKKSNEKIYRKSIEKFKKILGDKHPQALENFNNNFKSLKIKDKTNSLIFKYPVAQYNPKTNELKVNCCTCLFNGFEFALFQIASSEKQSGIYCSGFSQITDKVEFGTALNNGYTVLITTKYYDEIRDCLKAASPFEFEYHLVQYLVDIVGRDQMENLYLNADLIGLINELTKYASEEEVETFISEFDFLSKQKRSKKQSTLEEKIKVSAYHVTEFLVKNYSKKLRESLEMGISNRDQFEKELLWCMDSFKRLFFKEFGLSEKFLSPILSTALKDLKTPTEQNIPKLN